MKYPMHVISRNHMRFAENDLTRPLPRWLKNEHTSFTKKIFFQDLWMESHLELSMGISYNTLYFYDSPAMGGQSFHRLRLLIYAPQISAL